MSRHVPRHTFRPSPLTPPHPPCQLIRSPPPSVSWWHGRHRRHRWHKCRSPTHNTTQRRPRVTRHTLCGGTVARHGRSPPPPVAG